MIKIIVIIKIKIRDVKQDCLARPSPLSQIAKKTEPVWPEPNIKHTGQDRLSPKYLQVKKGQSIRKVKKIQIWPDGPIGQGQNSSMYFEPILSSPT